MANREGTGLGLLQRCGAAESLMRRVALPTLVFGTFYSSFDSFDSIWLGNGGNRYPILNSIPERFLLITRWLVVCDIGSEGLPGNGENIRDERKPHLPCLYVCPDSITAVPCVITTTSNAPEWENLLAEPGQTGRLFAGVLYKAWGCHEAPCRCAWLNRPR